MYNEDGDKRMDTILYSIYIVTTADLLFLLGYFIGRASAFGEAQEVIERATNARP